MKNADFGGWVTRNNLLCADGRTIRQDAFKDNDGMEVPLVWMHQHNDPENVLGHVLLENRNDGVYGYGVFNDTESGRNAKGLVSHGDVRSLSIWANKLTQNDKGDVLHGTIREVSLVLAGANPGAYIDTFFAHGEDGEDSIEACYDENIVIHSDSDEDEPPKTPSDNEKEPKANKNNKTVQEVIDTMTDEQKTVLYGLVGKAIGDKTPKKNDDNGGKETMKHNLFDQESDEKDTLMHDALIHDAIRDAKRYGSMRESFIEHAKASNIDNYDYILPDPKELNNPPRFIKDDERWVSDIMTSVKHTPFSRVKTTFATLDETEARARGYIKGKQKKDIALALLKRVTTPTTVYIKMKMDRDDVVDITDFDVVTWQRNEMRGQLDKELARAFLIGDGRNVSSEDKINEQNIRPVVSDDDLYTIKYTVTEGVDYKIIGNSYSENDSVTKGVVRAAIKSRKQYKGSGTPTFYTTEDLLADLLLIEDQNGRLIYESAEKLATAMRVKKIVTIPEMETQCKDIYGIIVNMNDYTSGADKGGAVNVFDDFDIDFNQMKYLMETRCSGALTVPYSAIVLKKATASDPGHGE